MTSVSCKNHKKIMLRMLSEFDLFCRTNNLKYFITGGTLLGAVRHSGFIPWDDDVDLVMPRNDFERLRKFRKISENIEIVTYDNKTKYYHPFVHINVVDSKTLMVESFVRKQTGKGVFLDVFPLDSVPENPKIKEKTLKKLQRLESILSISSSKFPGVIGFKNLCKSFIWVLFSFTKKERICCKIDSIAKKLPYGSTKFVCHLTSLFNNPKRFITPIEEYSGSVLLKFEELKLPAPCGYLNILKRSYGDYMSLPPVSERIPQHGIEIFYRDENPNS